MTRYASPQAYEAAMAMYPQGYPMRGPKQPQMNAGQWAAGLPQLPNYRPVKTPGKGPRHIPQLDAGWTGVPARGSWAAPQTSFTPRPRDSGYGTPDWGGAGAPYGSVKTPYGGGYLSADQGWNGGVRPVKPRSPQMGGPRGGDYSALWR